MSARRFMKIYISGEVVDVFGPNKLTLREHPYGRPYSFKDHRIITTTVLPPEIARGDYLALPYYVRRDNPNLLTSFYRIIDYKKGKKRISKEQLRLPF